MTVTTGEARKRRKGRPAVVTCAPRYDGTTEELPVPSVWAPVARKLAAVGHRRARLPHPSPQRRDRQEAALREKIWGEIRRLWYDEAEPVGLPKATAMQLLGISRQAFYNIINHQVGDEVLRGPSGPPATHGAAHIRAWAREHGVRVPDYGPIPHEVLDTYMQVMSGEGGN